MSSARWYSTCQSAFEQGVALALNLWPALTLAVQNNWGGADSADKRDWFAGAVVELFPDMSTLSPAQLQQKQQKQQTTTTTTTTTTTAASGGLEEPDQEDVEAVLLQVMLDEFEVNVDDDSAFEVAEQVVRVRGECLRGKFDEVEGLRRRWEGKGGEKGKVVFQRAEDQDGEETDGDSDEGSDEEDGEEDVAMGEAPALVRREKEEPEVDEEGFTTVSRKRK
ncbi:hypothetical protein BT67DRAFT_449205 [Trichocladium antarcticum]|uniref:Pre-rRNA-processing protein TSR2 n=1 Tax=Trichocladium antarcticum TaxID=1450529 RepID=A0AAN6UKV9_9PEZI|nr:hypothetical protein BT67DRAFT_449205 [Trichocladium antarcticum]